MGGEAPAFQIQHDSPPPKDLLNIVKLFSILSGFSVLFVSSALIINSDYYTFIFGEKDGEQLLFLISFLISLSSPFVQVLFSYLQHKVSFTSRVFVCFGLNTILAFIFPLILNNASHNVAYIAALLIALTVGINNAILKITLLSLVAFFPPSYSGLVVIGKGISPLAVIIIKIIIKVISDRSSDKYHTIRTASTLFFWIAACMPVACAVAYRVARKSAFSKFFFPSRSLRLMLLKAQQNKNASPDDIHPEMHRLTENPDQAEEPNEDFGITSQELDDIEAVGSLNSDNNNNNNNNTNNSSNPYDYQPLDDSKTASLLDTTSATPTTTATDDDAAAREETTMQVAKEVNKLVVMKKIALPLTLMIITFFTAFSIYPGVLNKCKSTVDGLDNAWMHIITLAIFAVFDFIARSLPYNIMLKICSVQRVDLLVYARVFFIPIIYYAAYVETFASQMIWLLTAILAFTTGISFVILIRNYQHMVEQQERAVAGGLMSVAIVVGVMFGNIMALFVEKVIAD